MDPALFDFTNLEVDPASFEGDTAFDDETFPDLPHALNPADDDDANNEPLAGQARTETSPTGQRVIPLSVVGNLQKLG